MLQWISNFYLYEKNFTPQFEKKVPHGVYWVVQKIKAVIRSTIFFWLLEFTTSVFIQVSNSSFSSFMMKHTTIASRAEKQKKVWKFLGSIVIWCFVDLNYTFQSF